MYGKKNPAIIYLLKVNARNTRQRCKTCSKLRIKTPDWRYWCRSGVFIVNFEKISNLFFFFFVFLLLTLNWWIFAGETWNKTYLVSISNLGFYAKTMQQQTGSNRVFIVLYPFLPPINYKTSTSWFSQK